MCSMNTRQSIPKGSHTCKQLKLQQLRLFFTQLLARVQLHKIRARKKLIAKIGNLTKGHQTLGRFIPKGSHSCN
ncbi:hypothetical protein BU200_02220 [Streptococcus acidominimus]|uniref:Uncharacterized protein n=1 Tax=Streptococcus acidominimus TaxID=1326 RepID=A0A1Q8EF64_STRAI|nr:hypothetical protein BU200_02220 [Streptococcus acidominimus]SUN06380.1 Uncharacterised protein [Streptococcus acidominimus]